MSSLDLKPRPKSAEPWSKLPGGLKQRILIASTVPTLVSLAVMFGMQLDFMAVLFTTFLPLQLLAGGWVGFTASGKRGVTDGLLVVVTFFFSAFVLVLLASVLYSVLFYGAGAISPHFIYQNNVYVTATTGLEIGGVGHAILGTLILVGISTVITVPLGVITAVYLTETRDKGRGFIRTLLQAMSGLPSIVAGLFIYSMLIVSGLSTQIGIMGALALIPLMLPTVSRVAEESLRLVPAELRNGALALGAPAWRAFFMVTLPAARSGIVTAVLLGIARIIGETAPLILVTVVGDSTNLNPLDGPIATLPTYMYNALIFGYDVSIQRAWGAALMLLLVVGIIFAAARIAVRPVGAQKKKKVKK